MRIFLAGGSGVMGRRLVPLLVGEGHTVVAMTRSPGMQENLARLGAVPVLCNVYDLPRLVEVVRAARPDVVLHELTDLPDDPAHVPAWTASLNRIRREGTANLLHAAEQAGARHVVAQSVAFPLAGEAARAVADLERQVLQVRGTVLRYGRFYGPSTYHEASRPAPPRIHISEAARLTAAALLAPPGIQVLVGP